MIGNLSKSTKGGKGDAFTYEDFTPEQLADLRSKMLDILNPDIETTEFIPVEVGGLNRKTGALDERDDAIRSATYIEVTPGKTVFFTSSLPVDVDGDDHDLRVHFYDSDFAWVESVYLELNTELTIKPAWRYLRFYRSDTSDTTVMMALVTRTIKYEFKKIYFADHGYSVYGAMVDDSTMHKLVIEASGKDDNEYNIVEIKAPRNAPHEASLALMTKGDDIVQFVDFSSMAYDPDNPTVEIVCQTRGGYKLPEFSVRYNNGRGAGRVKKFAVQPDCIPMTLTSEGIQVRRNNKYDNNATKEELVTVNLAELYDKINELELLVNKLLVKTVTISLLASEWVEENGRYAQVVSIPNATPYSKVDLQPSAEQLSIFHEKDIAFVTENENGVITVCCIGQKPTNDYVMQATMTEVAEDE